jgi:hypothetical protein
MGTLLNTDTIEITARLPFAASLLFFNLFLIGLIFSLFSAATGYYFVAFSIFIFLLSYFIERNRLRIMLVELKELLSTGH